MYHNYDKYVSYGMPVGGKNIILVFLKLLDKNRVEMEKLESIKTTLKFRIDREQGKARVVLFPVFRHGGLPHRGVWFMRGRQNCGVNLDLSK